MSEIIEKIVDQYVLNKAASLRVNPEKHIAKWIASNAIKKWDPTRPLNVKWNRRKLLASDVSKFVKMLKLQSVSLEMTPASDYTYNAFVDIGGDEVSFELQIPFDWQKSKIYNNVYSIALHELTHVRQEVMRTHKYEPYPTTSMEYITLNTEIEAHLKQFKAQMSREHKGLEEIIRWNWEPLLSEEELNFAVELYKKEYKKLFGKEAP